MSDNYEVEFEQYVHQCKKKIDLGFYQDHSFLIKKIQVIFLNKMKTITIDHFYVEIV